MEQNLRLAFHIVDLQRGNCRSAEVGGARFVQPTLAKYAAVVSGSLDCAEKPRWSWGGIGIVGVGVPTVAHVGRWDPP
jgi:hypothetical protein